MYIEFNFFKCILCIYCMNNNARAMIARQPLYISILEFEHLFFKCITYSVYNNNNDNNPQDCF